MMAQNIFSSHINLWTTMKFGFHHKKIKKARLVPKVAFKRYFIDESRHPKIMNESCHNWSQIDVTKTLHTI